MAEYKRIAVVPYGRTYNTRGIGMYWVPRYKAEIVVWLRDQCGYKRSALRKMAKRQLYAVYHSERKRMMKSV